MEHLNVALGSRSYAVSVGLGAIDLLSKHGVPENAVQHSTVQAALGQASSIVLVTNTTVHTLLGARLTTLLLALNTPLITVVLPDGEAYKTQAQLDEIYSAMLTARCDRRCLVVALGGGVVGDVAGYAAATYMRGVPFIQIPTTLLAQVDSSVGGKTAINHPLGKNMIGAFYQPLAVLADSTVLATLPAREISAGLAEIIKYGCIVDAAFFVWLQANMPALLRLDPVAVQYAVAQSCRIKADVVAKDEYESGQRELLNFGHTFGHAFEHVLGYGTWLHGEAVGYGMVCAAHLSLELGLIDKQAVSAISHLVQQAGLPMQWPQSVEIDALIAAMQIDKKTQSKQLRFVVLDALGASHVRVVEQALLRTVLLDLRNKK